MKRWFKIFLCLASVVAMARGEVSAHEFSANIDSVERATNGIHINFSVTGAPDFIDIEGSPTLTGIYREEQDVEMDESSPGHMRAFVAISTDDRFFRIRLLAAGVTNSLILPIEAQNSFSDGMIFAFDRPFQQIYAASELLEAPADKIDIHGIAFRLEETTSSMDTIAPKVVIKLGMYRGAMADLPFYGFVVLENAVTVVDRDDVRLVAPAGRPPEAFDVEILFDRPYHYDRSIGHLVVEVDRSPPADYRMLDGGSLLKERGWHYADDFPNRPQGGPGMVATKFLHTAIPEP